MIIGKNNKNNLNNFNNSNINKNKNYNILNKKLANSIQKIQICKLFL